MRKVLVLLFVFGLLCTALLVGRFLLGGDEDTWICSGGQWVRHGNPSAPMPNADCR